MSIVVMQSGMIFLVHRTIFGRFSEVAIHDNGSVKGNFDFVSLDIYLLLIPFAHGFQEPAFCRKDSINRSMILIRLQFCIHRSSIIEDLDFFPAVSSITIKRRVDPEAVVSTRRKLKLEAEDEIRVFLFSIEVSMSLSRRNPICPLLLCSPG